jgi:enediyne biosynthesis protein E4
MAKYFFSIGLIFLSITNCAQQKLFTLLPSSSTGVNFRNDIYEDGSMLYYKYENLYNGGGVGIGDFNNDGLQDIYFTSTTSYNKLFLNLGNLKFKDVTDAAGVNGGMGVKTGVTVVDINNDGFLDIFLSKSGLQDANYRTKVLYINNGNGTFTDKAEAFGLADQSFTTQSYFFDYDKDGDLDVYMVNHPKDFAAARHIPAKMLNGKMVYAEDTATLYVSDRLYENKGNKFVDVTKKAGLINHSFGLSAHIFDFNKDGWSDIYVANDFNKPDFIYINKGNGTFVEKLSEYIGHTSYSSMGSDINDINNDGHEDVFVVDMAIEEPKRQKQLFAINNNYDKFQLLAKFNLYNQYSHNAFQLNNGNGTFSEIAYHADVAETDWSWAPLIIDLDNDGWKDIFVTNGYYRDVTDWDYKAYVLDSIKNVVAKGVNVDLNEWFKLIPSVRVKNYFYHNNKSLKLDNFSDVWCTQPGSFSNGGAYADLDNDGDLDLITNNIADEAFIYKNNSEQNLISNFLRLQFFKNKTKKQEVYGASVKLIFDDGSIQAQHYDPQRGFMSSNEHFMHFGTGANKTITKVEISFLSGKKMILSNVPSNQVLSIYEDEALNNGEPKVSPKTIFTTTNSLNYNHVENDFIDFKREPLIPYKCSRKGPYFSKADVNGDKLEDIFIGGAAGASGKLFLQTANGSFIENKQPIFEKDKALEDNGVLFFDADGDGDNDLYIVSGGAEFEKGSINYQDRLYINNGKGIFTKTTNALPIEANNGSCVIPFDYDNDGDLDLFVGGGVVPGKFPQADESMILQNNKGVFTNVVNTLSSDITKIGIVNTATWVDADGDKQNDLIITGEWMGTTIFKFVQGKFVTLNSTVQVKNNNIDTTINLTHLKGWWNIIKPADVDNDGDIDFVLGNRGTNSKIECGITTPTTIYAKDFDGNGSYDALLGYYIFGKCYPMYSRDQLIDQMPMFRKKFIRYNQYSGKTMDEIFTTEQKQGIDIYTANCFESGVLYNNGGGSFTYTPFAEKAQFSTVNDFVIEDFDKDGINDILVCGNSNDPDVTTGNYDATAALLLKGNANGKFTAVDFTTSGLKIKGEVRKMIYLKDKKQIIFLKNNAAAHSVSF